MKRKEPTHSKDSMDGASSSWTSPYVGDCEGGTKKLKGNDYEVFLSFRGKDTRKGFTDYLYTSLVDSGIHVFRDNNELRVGEEIGPELLCSITQSMISIPIISEDYASSKWCLHELAQMLKCKRSRGQIVLPIFYKVEPSHVRHLTGRFGDAINAHKENSDQMVVKEWEDALKEVSSLKGWESEKIDNGHEAVLVKMVVRRVMSELKRLFQLNVPEQLVGTDDRVEQIMSKIDAKFNGTWIIGIYGMGGVGKTTLAKVLYNKLSSHFENRSFVANIREISQRDGIKCLQKQLIYDIIGSSCEVSDVDDGIGVLKSRFTSKKVLTLLDDMDDDTHLNALVGDGSWFKAGSIVIITTRDKSILDKTKAGHMYELNELHLDHSMILFSRHAFRKDFPPRDYEDISSKVVFITGGLPLALEVIGSFLCGKTKEAWEDTSKKLKKVPNKKVQEALMISYEALDYEEQQIFLDIACFFIGASKQSPTYMWDACDFFPGKGIEVLSLMSLIKVDEYGKLMMHDQLRDLGREIVRLENPKKPQKRSRLWIHEEAEDVLASNKGTSKIEALHLGRGEKSYRGEQFNGLTNLRFLHMDNVKLIGDFQNLLPQLRWLEWGIYPLHWEVTNFHPKKLVVLDLSWGWISEDWGGWGPLKMLTELKVLNLSYSINLRRTPDFSAFESLEILIVEGCWDLEDIHPSIWYIKTLVSLNVQNCPRLKELPAGVGRREESRELLINDIAIKESIGSLVSLTQLNLSCTGIEELPESIDSMKALETLDASWCASLARIPSSIGNLASLSLLNLRECNKLAQLPDSIGSLVSLQRLLLCGCLSLREIPDSIGKLASLTELQLAKTSITKLPESIGNLASLSLLDLTQCNELAQLPDSIGSLVSLQRLLLHACRSLREIPDSIGKLASLTELQLARTSIATLPESIGNLQSLRILHIDGTRMGELPSAIGMLAKLQELSASGCKYLKGLPSNIGELVSLNKLHLDKSSILGLPDSIGSLVSLSRLLLRACRLLREIPDSIGKLASLTELQLARTFIAKLPESIGNLQSLRILNIDGTCMTELPSSIRMLAKLQELSASGCEYLKGLPSNIGELVSLNKLHLDESGILGLPESISKLSSLQKLSVQDCKNLRELPELPSSLTVLHITCQSPSLPCLSQLTLLKELALSDCRWLECLPGLPVGLSKVSITRGGPLTILPNLKHLSELILDQCFQQGKVAESCDSCIGLHIDEPFPDSPEVTSPNSPEVTSRNVSQLKGSLDFSSSNILEETNAANCVNLVEIQGHGGLKSSPMLDISENKSARRTLHISSSKYLKKLVVTNCKNLTEIGGLDGLKSLEVLDISGCTSLGQSLDLSNLKNLAHFNARMCHNLDEIRGLDGLESLRYLDISWCESLRQSLDLSNLKNLTHFYAENCNNLVEIRGLDGLKSSKYLDIGGCASLKHLSNFKDPRSWDSEIPTRSLISDSDSS